MVMDDNETNLFVLKEVIESMDMKALTTSSPKECFNILEKSSIQLIIMDIQMPDVDGFEMTKRIKAVPEHASIPLMFLTAKYGDDDSILEGLNLGAVEYLTKPIIPALLKKKIEILLTTQNSNVRSQKTNSQLRRLLKNVSFH